MRISIIEPYFVNFVTITIFQYQIDPRSIFVVGRDIFSLRLPIQSDNGTFGMLQQQQQQQQQREQDVKHTPHHSHSRAALQRNTFFCRFDKKCKGVVHK
jgi:hypothetical protein